MASGGVAVGARTSRSGRTPGAKRFHSRNIGRERRQRHALCDLVDEPVRWLRAAEQMIQSPEDRGRILAELTNAEVGGWSSSENARISALLDVVAAPWRRKGVGRAVFVMMAGVARHAGLDEIVLSAPGDDQATLGMLNAIGLRGLIKLKDGLVQIRVSLADIRPVAPRTRPAPGVVGAAEAMPTAG